MTRRQYVRPPIQEAMCELRFEGGAEWDLLSAGKLLAILSEEYPAQPKAQLAGGIEIEQGEEAPSVRWRPGEQRVVFGTLDDSRLVVAGPTSLGVHVLSPYEGWESFSRRIGRALSAYRAVLDPPDVRRIGVRYVNRILLPGPSADLDDYFTIGPRSPESLTMTMSNFLIRVEANFKGDPARVVQTLASSGAEDERAVVVLDLDVVRDYSDRSLDIDEVADAIEHLRDLERRCFEAMITERSREMFDAS